MQSRFNHCYLSITYVVMYSKPNNASFFFQKFLQLKNSFICYFYKIIQGEIIAIIAKIFF